MLKPLSKAQVKAIENQIRERLARAIDGDVTIAQRMKFNETIVTGLYYADLITASTFTRLQGINYTLGFEHAG
jgi:hypothetical protein